MGDIFKSKVKLLEVITKWSILRGVSFTSLKTNKTCYTAVCASVVDDDNASRDVCLWDCMPLFLKIQVAISKLESMQESMNEVSLH